MSGDMISREALIRKLEAWDKGANGIPNYVWKVIKELQCEDKGEISDGYHTFNQLYHQRAVLFAAIVNQNKEKAWKSYKHSDGKYCFDSDGEWFIVGVDTPEGSFTYHYAKEYWDMFHCEELEVGKEWDGHTEDDVTRLLTLEQQSWDDIGEQINKKNCATCGNARIISKRPIEGDNYIYCALSRWIPKQTE